ncbi:unnamed protein product [Linum tenue]|uniref:Chaperone DnaJ C-terminal domain-containing protein n=1 Tax=Linum tenue TaxID=586396 RepID=A0AAV0RVX4_9ROSI|nr:unnamed protein product [Linum tenue]
MVDDHHRHNSETILDSSTTSDVASQSCDSNNIKNPNNNNSSSPSSSSSSEKTCRRFKAKDFWRIYGALISGCCGAARNNNNHSLLPTSPPPERPPESLSTSPSSSCCSDVDKAGLEERDQPAPGLAPKFDSQRVEEEQVENTTMNGIHSCRYTTTAADPSTSTTTTTPNGTTLKQKNKEKEADFLRTITNPLSRIASKRSPSPSPKSSPSTSSKNGSSRRSVSPLSFVHRCIIGRKAAAATTATPPPPADHHHHSPFPAATPPPSTGNDSQRSTPTTTTTIKDGAGPTASLRRDASVRSTTPIMFSNSTGRKVKPPPLQQNLECTLEELFYGCTKKVKVTRDVLTDRGQIVQEEETLSIQVKPGWRRGTKITFQGMGNERLGSEPADVTFVIVEKRHALFQRVGDDLEIAIGIPLVQALTGCDISIPLIGGSGETMNLAIQDVIYPGYQKLIPGQGMPKSKEEGKRGSLRVLFLVEFPDELTDEQRAQVVSILEEEAGS